MLDNVPITVLQLPLMSMPSSHLNTMRLDYLLKPINPKGLRKRDRKVNTNLIERAEKNEKKLALDNQIL
jgi:two-component SAPR family response regulator